MSCLLVVKRKHCWFCTLGSWFGSEGQVPRVTWYFSGRGGGLQGDGGLVWCCGGRSFLRFARLGLSGGLGTKVGQRQGDGSHVVDPQQDL